ncbi:hypothetical protein CMI47_11300 [Candidatus Pacearchaeota archaeon]|nr:hypothetical protein [Candidatus Pacearchaeota archaeon]|tara:strand:- start:2283 stop:2567 length:285 start_codon:yes stop_codon:yes gene_type:complete
MNSHEMAKLLYESYPHNDLLDLDPATSLKDMDTLLEDAKLSGDTLFLFLVRETHDLKEEDGSYTEASFEHLIYKAIDELHEVLDAMRCGRKPNA